MMTPLERVRRLGANAVSLATAAYVARTWQRDRKRAQPHALPRSLTVSLTSYPPRFPTLALTLESLLAQSVAPDRIELWIADGDYAAIPDSVARLQLFGITIRTCEDLRSYKKLIPALKLRSDALIVIADDDVYYPRDWLRTLTNAYRPGRREVICTRAHRIRVGADALPLPYAQWDFVVNAADPSPLLFPTGIGGVLYEPEIFHPDVTRSEIFAELCPVADDVWFYWMAACNGARFRVIGPPRRCVTWLRSQRIALARVNHTGNDAQIRNMIERYGFPARAERIVAA